RQRRELTGRLARIRKSYEGGDKPEDEYLAERDQIERALGALRGTATKSDVLAKATAFLRHLPAAWEAARERPDQRNVLAALVFGSVEVTDDRVTALVVNPDFAPFFAAAEQQDTPAVTPGCLAQALRSGSDGIRTRDL